MLMKSEEQSDDGEGDQPETECDLLDFCSNEDLLKRRQIPQYTVPSEFTNYQRCDQGISELLNELLEDSSSKISSQNYSTVVPVITDILLPKPVFEELSTQVEHWIEEEVQSCSKSDSDEEKDQEILNVEEVSAPSDSTDDAQEITGSLNFTNSNAQYTPQANMKPRIDLDSKKQPCSSECGDAGSIQEIFAPNSICSSEKSKNEQNIDFNNRSPLVSTLSPQTTKFKKKNQFSSHQTQNKHMNNHDIGQDDSQLEEESKFLIIRSSKSFVPQNNPAPHSNNLTKKKKKKRSKAVGPQANSVDQSSILNSFMRNMISNADQEEQEEYKNDHEETKVRTQASRKSELINDTKAPVKQIYVKKGSMEEQKSKPPQENKLIGFIKQSSKEESYGYQQTAEMITSKGSLNTKSMEIPLSFNQSKMTNRFEQFINDKDNATKNYRSSERGYGIEKPKKKSSKQQRKNNWGQSKTNKKSCISPHDGISKRNNNQHKKKESQSQAPFMSAPVSRTQSTIEPYCPQMMPMMADPNLGYDMYSQIDQNSLPYLSMEQFQSFINNATVLMHTNAYMGSPVASYYYENQDGYSQQVSEQMIPQTASNAYPAELLLDETTEQYFEMIEEQMSKLLKKIEKKLDSVRKERGSAISIIEELIKKTYNDNMHYHHATHNNFVGIKMYGSMASGLAIDSSDVDLAVTGLDFGGNRELLIKEMRQLYEQLEFVTSKSSLKFIESAMVPVIKLEMDLQKINKSHQRNEKLKGLGGSSTSVNSSQNQIDPSMRHLGIDITFEDQSAQQQVYDMATSGEIINPTCGAKVNLGIQCISYIQSLCMHFVDLKPIVMVLKKLLEASNLNQPYHGGLSSYSLVLMTSTFLNTCAANSMGKNLTEFLNYYGNYFDPAITGLNGEQFYSLMGIQTEPMVVIDPLNALNNTTKGAFRISDIQHLFRRAHKLIMEKLEAYQASSLDPNQEDDIDVIKLIVEMSENELQI